ncbi:MAG: c-type cytochrome biogenesis protein CcmI [Acidobacteria bacterium]|nr:MAG: c-type cytochrome biogenesis protein CcmI [Acidobacteriota bacterium]
MILFWLICAVFIVIALAFVLPPLLQRENETDKKMSDEERKAANIAVYRDQLDELKGDLQNGIVSEQQFEEDSEEIKRRLLEDVSSHDKSKSVRIGKDKNMAYVVAVAIPLIAVVFYLQVGTPKGIGKAAQATAMEGPAMGGGGGERTPEQIAANVEKLAKRLKDDPSDVDGWVMLARSYSSMDRFGEATGAYAKATELKPNDADLWAEYAFATAMANNHKIDGKALELINQALKVDPDNAKALQLSGTAAFDNKDYKKAIEIWQKVLSRVPAGSDVAEAITERINEAKTLSVSK